MEECHVPLHGHVTPYVGYEELGAVWTINWDGSPMLGPRPSVGLVCTVTWVDGTLVGVGDHGVVPGPVLFCLYTLSPFWDCVHVSLSGGRPFSGGSPGPVSGACTSSGSPVGGVEAMAVADAVVRLAAVLRWSRGQGPLPGHAAWEGCVHDVEIVAVGRCVPSALCGQL